MKKSNWDTSNIPDLKGKVIVVTGSTSGLGKEAAKVLAGKNAKVIMAVRNVQKGEGVADEIRHQYPKASIDVRALDLSDLTSVRNFSEELLQAYDRLDVLINNAGIMFCPFSKTADDFEIQMGTNHLGHFALVGHLMPLLNKTKDSRVVVTSSAGHKLGKIDLSDLNWAKRKYKTTQAYADSKIANLYFTYELARKLKTVANAPKVTASHPGWTRTELQRHSGLMQFLNKPFSQGPDMGVLPTLRAAFDPAAQSGDYFGPSRFFEMHGYPVKVKSNKLSQNESIAKELWEI